MINCRKFRISFSFLQTKYVNSLCYIYLEKPLMEGFLNKYILSVY